MALRATIPRECLKIIMRPFVRRFLRASHTLQDFVDLAKVVFVEEAAGEISRVGEKVNVSRLSAMTGLHRRDVTKIYREGGEPERATKNLLARVMVQWENDPRFCTREKRPRVLSYSGENREFRELVESVSKNLHAGTILFEMERIGAIERTKKGLKLKREVQRFNRDPTKGFSILAEDVESLLKSVEENILGEEEVRNLHLRTTFDNIFRKDIPHIRAWLLEEGKGFHKRAREFLAQFDKDINPGQDDEAGERVVLAAFSLTESRQVETPRESE